VQAFFLARIQGKYDRKGREGRLHLGGNMFQKEYGDWVQYRELGPLEVDFHHNDYEEYDGLSYYERMEQAGTRTLEALKKAQQQGNPWVLFTHGWSTSRPGATTFRSVVRGVMRSKESTPYIIRKKCIQHESVFLAAIRLSE
jgi:hypothetical protein